MLGNAFGAGIINHWLKGRLGTWTLDSADNLEGESETVDGENGIELWERPVNAGQDDAIVSELVQSVRMRSKFD